MVIKPPMTFHLETLCLQVNKKVAAQALLQQAAEEAAPTEISNKKRKTLPSVLEDDRFKAMLRTHPLLSMKLQTSTSSIIPTLVSLVHCMHIPVTLVLSMCSCSHVTV